MDQETIEMLRVSVSKVLGEDSGVALGERLAGLGWDQVLDDDAPAALQMLFEIKGETVAAGDALGPVLARAAAAASGDPALAEAVVVLPDSLSAEGSSGRVESATLVVKGWALTPPGTTSAVAPVRDTSGALRLAVIPAGTAWQTAAAAGTDPDLGLLPVAVEVPAASVGWIDGGAAGDTWLAVVAAARWTLAAELIGIGRHVIGHAVAYAGERRQYGRAIGSFQAVQHRLAAAHASVVGARHVVEEAAVTGDPWAAMVAKALAGRAAETACTQAQQTYGAIGFTWEHEFHHYLRRTYALDWIFGDWRALETEIGRRLLETGAVPRIGMLGEHDA